MNTKNMEARREAFEAAYPIPDGVEFNGNWYMGGVNVTGLTCINLQWQAWNAALDSICVELPQPMPKDDPYASYEGGWNDMRSEVQDALAAAGVPYK